MDNINNYRKAYMYFILNVPIQQLNNFPIFQPTIQKIKYVICLKKKILATLCYFLNTGILITAIKNVFFMGCKLTIHHRCPCLPKLLIFMLL